MQTNPQELLDFSNYLVELNDFKGSQCCRTACHKAYYSTYHKVQELFPDAIEEGRAFLREQGNAPTMHKALREGLILRSQKSSNKLEKKVLKFVTARLNSMQSDRVKADYKIGENFSKDAAKRVISQAEQIRYQLGRLKMA